MAKEKLPAKTLGVGKCPFCGHPVTFKSNSGGHLYAFCPKPDGGGCGIGTRSTDAKGDKILAGMIAKKRNDVPTRTDQAPADPPAATPAPEKKKGFDWNKEII